MLFASHKNILEMIGNRSQEEVKIELTPRDSNSTSMEFYGLSHENIDRIGSVIYTLGQSLYVQHGNDASVC